MPTVYSGEYHTLLVEDVIDSVAYGLCFAMIINIARTVLFPPSGFKPESIPSKKIRSFLFSYTFILVALASTFYLPFIISRASAAGSWFALSLDGSREEILREARRLKELRLYDPSRSSWARNAWIPFYINKSLAAVLMEYVVYQTWEFNKYIIGSTAILLFMHLVGSPLIFETVVLALGVLYLIRVRSSRALPFGLGKEKAKIVEGVNAPSATLVMVVSAIFAITTYVDTILHLTGVVAGTEVKFIKTVTFFGAFIIQAIVITYWAEGGPIYKKKGGGIALLDESPAISSEDGM